MEADAPNKKKSLKLDLGVGEKKDEGWIGIDKYKSPVTDVVMNLDSPNVKLPYPSDSVDEIRAFHTLEHITHLIPLMNECYRVLRFNGHMDIVVPTGFMSAFGDPTHVRAFSEESFHYFTSSPPGNYHNPEIQGFWKILKNDWSPDRVEDTEKITIYKRRELHVFLQPEKSPPAGWSLDWEKEEHGT